jgi:hypothetical protein
MSAEENSEHPVLPRAMTEPQAFDEYLQTIEKSLPVQELPPEYRRFSLVNQVATQTQPVPSMSIGPVESHNTQEYTCKCGRCQKTYDPEEYKKSCHLACVDSGPHWWRELK